MHKIGKFFLGELKTLRQDLDRAYTQFGNEKKYITNAAKNIFGHVNHLMLLQIFMRVKL